MDMLSLLAGGLATVFTPHAFTLLVLGIFIGVVAGALPGINFINAMVLALPFTYVMPPELAMVFLAGLYCGGIFGGSIASILINIPGSPGSIPAAWDGYPMTKKGLAAKALGIAITCSAAGGMASALIMIFVSQPFAQFALKFGPTEFFAATVLGLVSVVAIARGKMMVSLVSLFLGLAVGAVGLDPMYGQPRLTFGSEILENGISFVVVLVGMFAIGEVLWWVGERNKQSFSDLKSAKTKFLRPRELLKLKGPIARGAGIGCAIGAIPGAGAVIGAVIAYGVERQASKRGDEFGTGVEEGLAAPETAKNATTGTATIPLLTLGIPGSAATAIMLAALLIQGIQPGPQLFLTSAHLVYTIFAGYLVANVLMIVIGLIVARGFATLMRIPQVVLFGFITVLCLVGAFGVRNNIADVYICIFFGFLGYAMRRADVPVTPLILGVILGPLAERYFLTAMLSYNNDVTIFVQRPLSAGILALALAFMGWSMWPSIKEAVAKRRKKRQRPSGSVTGWAEASEQVEGGESRK
jgi:putative tricarboxylic transport membrane protein